MTPGVRRKLPDEQAAQLQAALGFLRQDLAQLKNAIAGVQQSLGQRSLEPGRTAELRGRRLARGRLIAVDLALAGNSPEQIAARLSQAPGTERATGAELDAVLDAALGE
jgi:hypothetical protein